MALTKTPIELSSTPSIVDGGNATAITIDSSENVLVGTTSTDIATEGTVIYGSGNEGVMTLSSTNMTALYVNRSNDGELAQFRTGGSTVVGSIGVLNSNNLTVTGSAADHGGLQFATHSIVPMEAGVDSDGTIDLGSSGARFKDLYLSGGVNFSANANAGGMTSETLDDYEEGTFQMTMTGVSGSVGHGKYVKIGSLVHWQFYSGAVVVAGSGAATLTGLPFATTSSTGCYTTFNTAHNTYSGTATTGYLQSGGVNAYITTPNTTSSAPLVAGNPKYIMASGTYYTDL